MRVVTEAEAVVEQSLRDGRLRCPACRGTLRPWGMARARVVRLGGTTSAAVRPRRARCSHCGATHVLLPDWTLLRRAYAAPVIWQALTAHARGLGYRRIALRLGLPETTVRDWLRAFDRPGPRSVVLELERRATSGQAWRSAVRATQGRLLANTNPPHVSDLDLSARLC